MWCIFDLLENFFIHDYKRKTFDYEKGKGRWLVRTPGSICAGTPGVTSLAC